MWFWDEETCVFPRKGKDKTQVVLVDGVTWTITNCMCSPFLLLCLMFKLSTAQSNRRVRQDRNGWWSVDFVSTKNYMHQCECLCSATNGTTGSLTTHSLFWRVSLVSSDRRHFSYFYREVEAANPAAVNLYRKFGFEDRENPNKLSKNLFMVKKIWWREHLLKFLRQFYTLSLLIYTKQLLFASISFDCRAINIVILPIKVPV